MQNDHENDIHESVTDGIAKSKRLHPDRVVISGEGVSIWDKRINRVSVEHLVDHLQGTDGQDVTVLHLNAFRLSLFRLSSPADDGALDVLCNYFASTTRLTGVCLRSCDFGDAEGGQRILESLRFNSSVTSLTIQDGIWHMTGIMFGECLSSLLESNSTLVSLALISCQCLGVVGIRALQRGIQSNGTLTKLCLPFCRLRDEGLGLIAESLVGNTTMQILDVQTNYITHNGIGHVTTLLKWTRLQDIDMHGNSRYGNHSLFNAQNLRRFRDDLVHNPHLLRAVLDDDMVEPRFPEQVAAIHNLLAQNRDLPSARQTSADQAKALNASQDESNETLSDNSIWFKAIVRLATRRCNSGASGIFHIFTARPSLLCLPETSPIATNQEGQQLLLDMAACQKLEPRINRLAQSSWQNEIRADLCRYFSSAGTDRDAFTRAVNRLTEYERGMEENAAEERQQMDLRHEDEAQPDAAAITHQRPGNHDDGSNNRKCQCLS